MWHTMSSGSYPEKPGARIVNKLSCPKRILSERVQLILTSLRNSDLQMRATQKSPLELERGKIALKKTP